VILNWIFSYVLLSECLLLILSLTLNFILRTIHFIKRIKFILFFILIDFGFRIFRYFYLLCNLRRFYFIYSVESTFLTLFNFICTLSTKRKCLQIIFQTYSQLTCNWIFIIAKLKKALMYFVATFNQLFCVSTFDFFHYFNWKFDFSSQFSFKITW